MSKDDIKTELASTSLKENTLTIKLTDLFSIIPEYDGDQILLNSFINSSETALSLADDLQLQLVLVHIKNKLRGKASQLINSRNITKWQEIKTLLTSHFGDSRDLNSLLYDLNRIKQNVNENPLSFVHRINSHNAKLHANINASNLNADQKTSQCSLVDNMCLDTLLTGLGSGIGTIVRASNPKNLLEAALRIKRETQLSYFENTKNSKPTHNKNFNQTFYPNKNHNNNNFNRNSQGFNKNIYPNTNNNFSNNNNNFSNPNNSRNQFCNYCKKPGHNINNCFKRQNRNQTHTHNASNNNFSNRNTFSNNQNTRANVETRTNPNNSNNFRSNQRSTFTPNQSNHLNEEQDWSMGASIPTCSNAQQDLNQTEMQM